jgi:transposase
MAQALSVDLRRRVVEAVAGGMSRRQAALRFGVSASSAIRWTAQAESSGDVAPKKQGGDRKSQRIEAYADFILAQIEQTPDLTLAELRARLVESHGAAFGLATLWRFFDRRRITFKKRRRTPPSRNATT